MLGIKKKNPYQGCRAFAGVTQNFAKLPLLSPEQPRLSNHVRNCHSWIAGPCVQCEQLRLGFVLPTQSRPILGPWVNEFAIALVQGQHPNRFAAPPQLTYTRVPIHRFVDPRHSGRQPKNHQPAVRPQTCKPYFRFAESALDRGSLTMPRC